MATITTDAPRIYLTVTGEDLIQVLSSLSAMEDCALDNASKDVYKAGYPVTTTFKFPLPSCMAIEMESAKDIRIYEQDIRIYEHG